MPASIPKHAIPSDSKRIPFVSSYRSKTQALPISYLSLAFVVAYLFLSSWVVGTIGHPYRDFLLKAEAEGFEVLEGAAVTRAEALHKFTHVHDEARVDTSATEGWFGWVGMDIEEFDKAKKAAKEQSVLDALPKTMRVPNRYMPGFWALLITGSTVTLHVLLLLMQVWNVSFNLLLNYNPCYNFVEGESDAEDKAGSKASQGLPPTTACIWPAAGNPVLVPVDYKPGLGYTLEYHRRQYVYADGEWSKTRCRTTMATSLFGRWTGFTDEGHANAAKLRFGPNEFAVRQPTFTDLYKKQLLSPLCVFQLFSVLLWLLDEYWQYSLFTLFMILMFEGTVVFQRIKSLGALKGMGNKLYDVHVFRYNTWMTTVTSDLLPGDIVSLKISTDKTDGSAIVPADVLVLSGSAVLSEASLTGESVPQMKEKLSDLSDSDNLAIKGKHKNHIMYAGTTMLQCKADTSSPNTDSGIPLPPDRGIICFVLRTGFTSSQGKLVRMIEGSQDKVKGHEVETAILLAILFVFACLSSGYVLKKGMEDGKRSRYELLLHCILIVTSVIPPELPMQTALAVNNSLMTLMKMQVFCTEPFRVPIAGKIDSCLFDKTGTLTTDELVAVGIARPGPKFAAEDAVPTPMTKIDDASGFVLAGCNSLICIENETVGDPLESAALKAMRWAVSSGDDDESATKIAPKPKTEKREAGKTFKVYASDVSGVEVLVRHHFSSKLQRMSAIVRDNHGRLFVVVKGSPEAIGERVVTKCEGYDDRAKSMAKKGLRVIALALKRIQASDLESYTKSRDLCECDLDLAGFIAFTCRVRKDTKNVLSALSDGGMNVTMVTGDALLTAAHVAKEVGICTEDPKILMLEPVGSNRMVWIRYTDGTEFRDYKASEIPNLHKTGFELSTTGKNLEAAYAYDDETKNNLWYFKIFARMSPDAKETVIENLHGVGHICLMCGDGANDVGALKQADVGVALLSGFGDVNVDKGEDGNKKAGGPTAMISQMELDKLKEMPVREIKVKIRELGVEPDNFKDVTEKSDLIQLYRSKAISTAVAKHDKQNAMDERKKKIEDAKLAQKEKMADKQRRMVARVAELEAAGESWAQFKAMKEFMSEEMAEANKIKAKNQAKQGVANSAAHMVASMEDLDDMELPMVKIGDASIAAPFTSKMPSIRSCVDIIRQGRCTLVTTLQMYQILALNCLISSYSLSVLYLDGVKYGDTQMTAMGLLMSVTFMSVSRSKPLDKLSKVRPLTSIFHPSSLFSLIGQFVVHLGTMYWAVQSAKKHLPADYEVNLDGDFQPGIVNSVVFLVSNVQQVTVFVVNLKGRPFMNGLTENRPLLYSLAATFILTFMFASESMPGLNKYFQLVPFPEENGVPAFRNFILAILAFDVMFSMCWDRLMQFLFAPKILFASLEGTTIKDVFGLVRTVAVIGWLMYMFVGDDETWEELLRDEELERARELGLDAVDGMLNATGDAGEGAAAVVEAATEAVGVVGKVVGEVVKGALGVDGEERGEF
jgi:cation-transporting ATPase 13A1